MPRERDVRLAIADAIARAGDVPRENIHPGTADEAAAKDDAPIVVAIEPHIFHHPIETRNRPRRYSRAAG